MAITGLLAMGWLINACKKQDQQATLTTLLITEKGWQLASLQRAHYHGDTLLVTDTLNNACALTQKATFNSDGSYNYENFSCLSQTTPGAWHYSNDKTVLISTTTFKDTSTTPKMPFKYARINNLGRNSLVLLQTDTPTADMAPTVISKHYTVTRYGFIRIQ